MIHVHIPSLVTQRIVGHTEVSLFDEVQPTGHHLQSHLMWQLLKSLQQSLGDPENSVCPIQDVLVHIPLQNTAHCSLVLCGGGQHLINGRPQGANLRTTRGRL